MIAGLEGTVAALAADHVVLNVGGVFYRVFVPGSAIPGIGQVGDTTRLHTYLYVREDQLALYGTTDERQLRMFESLIGVTGIGPKVGLSILSTMPVDALETAISTGNVDILTRVPGIGRKTATRLILEMKGKIDLLAVVAMTASPTATSEAVEALSSLGYGPAEIQAALATLPKDTELTTEDIVLFALKRLGR
jgi:holliday junction DNA helicase RuvA